MSYKWIIEFIFAYFSAARNSYINPEYKEVFVGQTVRLRCPQLSDHKPEWMFNHSPLNRKYPYTLKSQYIRIDDVKFRHAGIYTCHMIDGSLMANHILAFAQIKVFGMLHDLLKWNNWPFKESLVNQQDVIVCVL